MTRHLENAPFDVISASLGAAAGAATFMGLLRGLSSALSGDGLAAMFYWPFLTLASTPLVWLFVAFLFFPVYFLLRAIRYVNWLSLAVAGGVAALLFLLFDPSQSFNSRILLSAFGTGLAGGVSAYFVLKWCLRASRKDHAEPWKL